MIGAKHMDPVVGVDIHIINIPTPAGPVPTPIPHPFIGMVFDPFDFIPILGATVIVNGSFVGVAGTGVMNKPPGHIPIGGPFAFMPPGNEGEIFMGSMTVKADGEPFSYTGLPVLSCSDIGAKPPPREGEGGTDGMCLPTSVVLSIPMGMPVLVGGPPTISLMGMLMKLGLGAFKRLRGGKFMRGVSEWLNKKADDILGEVGALRNAVRRAICFVTGHPVDIATGKVFTDHVDFELPGPIPFKWERVWYSTSEHDGPIGHGWHHSYDTALQVYPAQELITMRLTDGRNANFPTLKTGEECFNRQEKLTLYRDEQGYFVRDDQQLYYRFAATDPFSPQRLSLIEISKKSGSKISFHFDDLGKPKHIIDSGGRKLEIELNAQNRIAAILAPHPEIVNETFPIVRYEYDAEGDLVKTIDPLGHAFTYKYQHHLLVQETNRNGLSFYFEYDEWSPNAKCTRTWGDEGIYDHKLRYEEGITYVTNSLGHTTINHHNGALVTKRIDPLGNETLFEYNQYFDTIAEIDPLERRTEYAYDVFGNRTVINYPDGTSVQMAFEENKLIQATDQIGGEWTWMYNEKEQLILRQDSMAHQTSFGYNEQGDLTAVFDPGGGTTLLDYDEAHNLIQLTSPDNSSTRWKYDTLGRNRVTIDPKGNLQRRIFDLRGDVIRVDEADSNTRHLKYDPESNIIKAWDKHHTVEYTYQGMNRLAIRKENDTTVQFKYDTEENLIGIINEHGSLYQFDLDANGEVEIESGFDDIKRYYKRDQAGRVASVLRASGVESTYTYDLLDRVTGISHSNGESEHFAYREDGELIEAQNGNSAIRFERDMLGNVLKEWQGDIWVESSYDPMSRRTNLSSSLGADLSLELNSMGDVQKLVSQTNSDPWEARFKRDAFGLETNRSFTGGIHSRWKRDQLGRPVQQEIFAAGSAKKAQRSRHYSWGINDRLTSIQVDQQKATQFGHDKMGNLAWANYEDGSFEYRTPDAVGNLFKKEDRSDRKYGPAGQLLEAEGTTYHYDEEGNLIRKVAPDGNFWSYEWNSAGMLKKVIRPDSREVSFSYDVLGRRLSKTFDDTTTRWVWDGNVPLHEWQYKETLQTVEIPEQAGSFDPLINIVEKDPVSDSINTFRAQTKIDSLHYLKEPDSNTVLTTWLFEPATFSPFLKIVDGKPFPIITNHLGTPIAMFDESGQMIWSAEISIYGKLRDLKGDLSTCPFRFPGQYEDIETGLYYNRFRYYDTKIGQYISQDPIRLRGNNVNFYSFSSDPNYWVDILGLIILYHYTNEEGMNGILESNSINPSVGDKNARFGTGQYFTDIAPDSIGGRTMRDLSPDDISAGKISQGQLAANIYGDARKLNGVTHFVAIEIDDALVSQPRTNTFLVSRTSPLPIEGKVVGSGKVCG